MAEQTYLRVDLAKEQLEVALCLFLDKVNHASVITLAGAAEEIFRKKLERLGREPVLEEYYRKGVEMLSPMFSTKAKKEFMARENRVKNALKHFSENDNESITEDLEYSAVWILVRACENAFRLGVSIKRYGEFEVWFQKNILGADGDY